MKVQLQKKRQSFADTRRSNRPGPIFSVEFVQISLHLRCISLARSKKRMPGYSFRAPQPRSRFLSSRFFGLRTQSTWLGADERDDESSTDEGHRKPNQGWGRGIAEDFRSTVYSHWKNEMTNFNTKTIAVSFFLFIAVIAPSITFGAVYAKQTNNYIGTVELLLATAWCGIFYSLVAGMPMVSRACVL